MADGWRGLAAASTVCTYLLIVLGGIVRVTGSGMGCGDDWPLCNGRLIPPLDFATWIEWGHRLVAALVSLLVLGLAAWALARRRRPGWAGRARLGAWAVLVLLTQVMLGAVTVWLELPPTTVVLHLGTAMLLLVMLLLAALGGGDEVGLVRRALGQPPARMAWALAALGAITVMLGGLVANLGAGPACQGFPLCNGEVWPGGHWRIHLHWTHRVAAYALALGALALPWVGSARARASARAAAGLAVAQIAIAAVMVMALLPQGWRIAHVAAGTALFAALVAHAFQAGTAGAHDSIGDRRA